MPRFDENKYRDYFPSPGLIRINIETTKGWWASDEVNTRSIWVHNSLLFYDNFIMTHCIRKSICDSSPKMIHAFWMTFSLLLHYRSEQSHQLHLKEFSLTLLLLWNTITEGSLLYKKWSLSKYIMRNINEMYWQQCIKYSGG